MIIRKVWYATGNNVKLITVPKDCSIKIGDYVKLTVIKDEE